MHKKKLLVLTILLAVCITVISGCEINISTNGSNNPLAGGSPASSPSHLGTQTKTSGCIAHGGLPDSACTPGAIFTNATVQQICTYGYTRSVRNVPYSEKDQVYAEY